MTLRKMRIFQVLSVFLQMSARLAFTFNSFHFGLAYYVLMDQSIFLLATAKASVSVLETVMRTRYAQSGIISYYEDLFEYVL